MTRVAILIVTHNSGDYIGPCLESLPRLGQYEVVVIDNASEDRTVAIASGAPRTRVIANPANAGFAAAVNQGVRATEAPLLLLLNPDTRDVNGLEGLISEFDDPRTGAAGGMLLEDDGRPQTGFMYRRLPAPSALILEVLGINHLWPRNPVNWHYRCLDSDPMAPCLVEQPAGAFLMFSRPAWEKLGGFDEQFHPIWFEDVDFCARLAASGFCVKYNPSATAIHAGGHSIRTLDVEKRERYWYCSLLGYSAIHYGPLMHGSVCLAVFAGALLRGVRSFPRGGFKALSMYGAVCRLALSRLVRPRRGSGCPVV